MEMNTPAVGSKVRVLTGMTRYNAVGEVMRHKAPKRGTATERAGLQAVVVRFLGGSQTDKAFDPRELEEVL
jgi:hypothetical protein